MKAFKTMFMAVATLMATATASAQSEIEFAPVTTTVEVNQGETFEVKFNLKNTVQPNTFQWWMQAPAGIEVAYDEAEDEFKVDFGNRLTANYSVTADYNVQNHNFLVLAFNATGKKLMPTSEGLFCTMTYKADIAPGTYTLKMFDSNFNWDNGSGVSTVKPADANITVVVKGDDPSEIVFAPVTTTLEGVQGEEFEVSFNLKNTVQPNTFQWWMKAPAGIEVAYDEAEDEHKVDFGSRLTANYSVTADYNVQNHNFLVLAFNATGKKLMPLGDGLFCTMTYTIDKDIAPGNYTLEMFDSNFNWDNGSGVSTVKPADATFTLKVTEGSGIEGVRADIVEGDGIYYDLTGRRVENPGTGFYIVDGKKVYLK